MSSVHVPPVAPALLERELGGAAGHVVLAADEDERHQGDHGGHRAPQLQLLRPAARADAGDGDGVFRIGQNAFNRDSYG